MTVYSELNKISYPGNGVSVEFNMTDIRVDDEDDVDVYLDGVLQTEGYTVSNIGDEAGAVVTFDDPPGLDVVISLVRVLEYTQETDYTEYSRFPAESVEMAFDKSVMQMIQLQEQVNRAILAPINVSGVDFTMPVYSAGKAIMWHATEQKLTTSSENLDTIIATAQAAAADAEDSADDAQLAQTAAETAQGLAETAQTAAETAQGLAETAQGAAEVAQTAAEGFADDAEATMLEQESELSIVTGEVDWAWDDPGGRVAMVEVTGTAELQLPSGAVAGMSGVLRVLQDGTGGHAFSVHASFDWGADGELTFPTDADTEVLLGFYYTGSKFLVWVNWQTA